MGGHVFQGKTEPIKKEWIEPTVDEYFKELSKLFPKKKKIFNMNYFTFLGSVGKKPYSGDIDLGIDSKTIAGNNFDDESLKEWNLKPADVKAKFEQLKKRARTSSDEELMMKAVLFGIVDQVNSNAPNLHQDEKKITTSNVFGFYPQFNEKGQKTDKGVQIDWMISDLELLKFSYYSAQYSPDDNVKGLHRTQLMIAMFQALDLSFSHAKGLTDKKTGELLTKDPKVIIKKLEDGFGVDLPQKVYENYFTLSDVLLNKVKDKKLRDDTIDTYFKILDSTRADIPENLQDEWRKRKKKLGLTGKFLPDSSKLKTESAKSFEAIYENIMDTDRTWRKLI